MTREQNNPATTGHATVRDASSFTVSQNLSGSSLRAAEGTVYPSGPSPDVVKHVHPASALGESIPMGAGKESQLAPLRASFDDILSQVEQLATTVEEYLQENASEDLRTAVREWSDEHGYQEQPFAVAARYATLSLLLKATLYEWYTRRGDVPRLSGGYREAFEMAANRTSNQLFTESRLIEIVWELPGDVVAEISWWRHGIMRIEAPADDLGSLFEEVIPAEHRGQHGQYRTPNRISTIMHELAVSEADHVLDAGMGAGALSVPRTQSREASVFGIEQSPLGSLMAALALALTGQPGVVHETDFFDISPHTLGATPDAAINMGRDDGGIDIVPGAVDVAIGNPPYVANRNLERESENYRAHLAAFGADDQTPYLDGEKRVSGRSDLFVYFVTHATQFLTDGGRLVYLLPTKWMETQYGQTLQTFLLDQYQLSAVIRFDDTVFDDAQVDAVILVADRCADAAVRAETRTRFLSINQELSPEKIAALVTTEVPLSSTSENSSDVITAQGPGYECVAVKQSRLKERDASDGPLSQYFTESDTLRSLKQADSLVPLDALASVTYGQKTGNNELFLLDDADLDEWPIAERFYRTAIADGSDITGYQLTTRDSDTHLLDVHAYVEALDTRNMAGHGQSPTQQVKNALANDGYKALLAYLDQWDATRNADSVEDDDVWFDLGPLDAPDIIHPYRIHRQVQVAENTDDLIPTNCANGITVKPGVETDALLGYLNSTVHAAFLELWGQSEGGGSLEVTTGTLKQVLVVDVRAFSDETRNDIADAYKALAQGEDDAQVKLDNSVLDALDVDIDATTLHDEHNALIRDRLASK